MGIWLFAQDGAGKEGDEPDEDDGEENPDAPAGGDGGNAEDGKKLLSQQDIDRIVERRLKRAKKTLADEIRGELRSEIEADIEAKNKDESLQRKVERLQTEVDRLKRFEALAEVAEDEYEEELAKLPEAVRLLAPDDDADIVTKQTWLVKKGRPAAAKIAAATTTEAVKDGGATTRKAKKGLRPDDPPANETRESRLEALRKQMRPDYRTRAL